MSQVRHAPQNGLIRPPSVDQVLGWPALSASLASFGRTLVKRSTQISLDRLRSGQILATEQAVCLDIEQELARHVRGRVQPVINLTGTVIHTNLGRAVMGTEVIEAVGVAMSGYCALEFDLTSGDRGDRDTLIEELVCRLTGAEAATCVNNCAAAVLLSLVALGARKEVIISRGEQIEIGGAFRMPDIMRAANCRLVEVGTTNRTHLKDYAQAISAKSALIVKAHRSNYAVTGFTAEVGDAQLAALAHEHNLFYMVDLGSGALIDMSAYGLPREPLPSDSLAVGADVVMFSGDKLLGGPQAGIIAGSRKAIDRIKKHPLKRALRASKMVLSALEATLRIYDSGHRLTERLPVLAMLTRPAQEVQSQAQRLLPLFKRIAGDGVLADLVACRSQIGSGALPEERIDSYAVRLRSLSDRPSGRFASQLLARFRDHRPSIIGRIHNGSVLFDCRCLLPADEKRLLQGLQQ